MRQHIARSAIEFLNLVDGNEPESMFRGQADASWPLLPSVGRFARHVEDGYEAIAHLEDHLVEKFSQYCMPFRDLRNAPLMERLVYCQHYGVPTRLLDWSTNPLKALFFAVEDPAFDGRDGSVHVTMPITWWEGISNVTSVKTLSACYPELFHERVGAQDACFLAFPLSEEEMHLEPLTLESYPGELGFLTQITIPAPAKQLIRMELAKLGITHRTVYPGLEGVARWVKSSLSNFVA